MKKPVSPAKMLRADRRRSMNDAIDPARAAGILMEAVASTFADMAFIDIELRHGGGVGRDIPPPSARP